MRYDGALNDHAILQTLGNEVREIDGSVDAYGFEDRAGVDRGRNLGLREDAEAGDDGDKPWCGGQQFVKPLPSCCLCIFFAIVDYGIYFLSAEREGPREEQERPWKWIPASGTCSARRASSGHVFFSHRLSFLGETLVWI